MNPNTWDILISSHSWFFLWYVIKLSNRTNINNHLTLNFNFGLIKVISLSYFDKFQERKPQMQNNLAEIKWVILTVKGEDKKAVNMVLRFTEITLNFKIIPQNNKRPLASKNKAGKGKCILFWKFTCTLIKIVWQKYNILSFWELNCW